MRRDVTDDAAPADVLDGLRERGVTVHVADVPPPAPPT
jgi:hypothetical protein